MKKASSRLFVYFSLMGMLFLTVQHLSSQERFRKSPPIPDPLPELDLPVIESVVLSNGLSMSVVRRENTRVLDLRLLIMAGESSSPENLPGLASVTANTVNKGTSSFTASAIEEKIEAMGGSFSVEMRPDYTVFHMTFLNTHFDDALELLSEMILKPTFPRLGLENTKRLMFYDLKKKNLDPDYLAKRILYRFLFHGNPYLKITHGEESIKQITRRDVTTFYNSQYLPNNARIILVGDLNLSTSSRKVSQHFSVWERKPFKKERLPSPETNSETKITFVKLPGAKQATIYAGNIIPSLSHQDVFPLFVLSQVLGGTPNSRLFMNLRESKGYAYLAFSEMEFFQFSGVFFIKARVRPEVIHNSIVEIMNELSNVSRRKIPHYEINRAKSYLIGKFPLMIERTDRLSFHLSNILAFNLVDQHWKNYSRNIMLMTSDVVYDSANKYSLMTPVVVIVGDPQIILDNYLKNFKNVEVYDTQGKLEFTIKGKSNETR